MDEIVSRRGHGFMSGNVSRRSIVLDEDEEEEDDSRSTSIPSSQTRECLSPSNRDLLETVALRREVIPYSPSNRDSRNPRENATQRVSQTAVKTPKKVRKIEALLQERTIHPKWSILPKQRQEIEDCMAVISEVKTPDRQADYARRIRRAITSLLNELEHPFDSLVGSGWALRALCVLSRMCPGLSPVKTFVNRRHLSFVDNKGGLHLLNEDILPHISHRFFNPRNGIMVGTFDRRNPVLQAPQEIEEESSGSSDDDLFDKGSSSGVSGSKEVEMCADELGESCRKTSSFFPSTTTIEQLESVLTSAPVIAESGNTALLRITLDEKEIFVTACYYQMGFHQKFLVSTVYPIFALFDLNQEEESYILQVNYQENESHRVERKEFIIIYEEVKQILLDLVHKGQFGKYVLHRKDDAVLIDLSSLPKYISLPEGVVAWVQLDIEDQRDSSGEVD